MKLRANNSGFWCAAHLSVSSNGSTWVKHWRLSASFRASAAFSILERIDVGETPEVAVLAQQRSLSVSSNGSTWVKQSSQIFQRRRQALSVSSNGSTWVKRPGARRVLPDAYALSVSSNGSTWVKLPVGNREECHIFYFQYPRTDRRG